MVGVPFQIQRVVQALQHFSLAGPGQAADQHEIALGHRLLGDANEEVTHGLVAADDARVLDARLSLEPLLSDLRAQTAAEAVEKTFGMFIGERCPGLDTRLLEFAGDQLVTQFDSRLLAFLLVAGADLLPLDVVHQRQVDHTGERALGEFHRGAYVHHRKVVEEDVEKMGAVVAHQNPSTASRCRSTSSPIGARFSPSSLAMARNAGSCAGSTAISSPPLVCGSHSSSFCASVRAPMRSPELSE